MPLRLMILLALIMFVAGIVRGMDVPTIQKLTCKDIPENVIYNMMLAEGMPQDFSSSEIGELRMFGLSPEFLDLLAHPYGPNPEAQRDDGTNVAVPRVQRCLTYTAGICDIPLQFGSCAAH